jgi:hypothetical protein
MKDKDSKGGDRPSYETPTVIPLNGESSDATSSCAPTGAADVTAGAGGSHPSLNEQFCVYGEVAHSICRAGASTFDVCFKGGGARENPPACRSGADGAFPR